MHSPSVKITIPDVLLIVCVVNTLGLLVFFPSVTYLMMKGVKVLVISCYQFYYLFWRLDSSFFSKRTYAWVPLFQRRKGKVAKNNRKIEA